MMIKNKKEKLVLLAVAAVLMFAVNAQAVGTGTLDKVSGWYPLGTNLTINATPETNSVFDTWLGDTNGASIVSTQITFTVTDTASVTGRFTEVVFHDIVASVVGSGSISPSGTVQVANGNNQAFTITPNANYHIVSVDVDTTNQGAVAGYTFTNVTEAHAIEATFAIDTYQVVFDLGTNGTRTGGGALTQTVNHAASATVPTVTPDFGYTLSGWDSSSYTNVTSNMTVNAQYSLVDYTLTYTSGGNGTIGGVATQTVSHGSDGIAVTPTPAANYHFVDWSDASTADPRTDTGVTNNITVSANFAIDTYTLTVNSMYGSPTPSGVTTSDWNTVIDAYIPGSPVELSGTTQYVANGWIGTGSVGNGTGTNTSFNLTNDTTISWQWTTNYWIELNVTGN